MGKYKKKSAEHVEKVRQERLIRWRHLGYIGNLRLASAILRNIIDDPLLAEHKDLAYKTIHSVDQLRINMSARYNKTNKI